MTSAKFRMECEDCGAAMIVTYDMNVPTNILGFHCSCGHYTPVKTIETVAAQVERNEDGSIKSVTLPGTGWS